MTAPLVSVLVAARDEARHLPACLGSVKRQRGVDFECIVISDGSVDATASIADAVARSDTRFRVVHNDAAGGLAAARNQANKLASAPWVTFLDGDDFLFPGALSSRADRLRAATSDVVGAYGDWVSVPERMPALRFRRRAATRPDIWMTIADRAVPFIASAPILRRDLVLALGGFDESLATAEDADFWQWWLRLLGRTVYVPQLAVGYRRRSGSMTRKDMAGHFRANRDAFASFDRTLADAPSGVLASPESVYRAAHASVGRAALAAAMTLADGNADEAASILSEIDADVMRVSDPTAIARSGTSLALRRVRGTTDGRAVAAALRDSTPALIALCEEAAVACPTTGELVTAAAWLAGQRATSAQG